MKMWLRALTVGALVLGLAPRALADTIWTLNDVGLHCPNCASNANTNTVTGSFTVNTALTQVLSWDIVVAGDFGGVDYTYDSADNPGNSSVFSFGASSEVTFTSPSFSPYLSLLFASSLSNTVPTIVNLSAGIVSFGDGTFSCANACGQLDTPGSLSNNGVESQSAVPEPGTLSLLGMGLGSLGLLVRRRIKR